MAQPTIIDITNELPRNAQNQAKWLVVRPLSDIADLDIHYNGPPVVEDEMTQLIGDANYHIGPGKDWNPPNRVRGWSIMYHYAVGRSGRIYKLNPETHITWHASNGNRRGLGILCILGKGQKPTPQMLASLKALVDWLTTERPEIPATRVNVWGHGELGGIYGGGPGYGNSTECPGVDLLAWVRAYRKATPLPEPAPQPGPEPDVYLDDVTGVRVAGAILSYFKSKGGWERFGRPITKEVPAQLEDGKTYTTQFFERIPLHLGEDGRVYEVRAGYMVGKAMGLVA